MSLIPASKLISVNIKVLSVYKTFIVQKINLLQRNYFFVIWNKLQFIWRSNITNIYTFLRLLNFSDECSFGKLFLNPTCS